MTRCQTSKKGLYRWHHPIAVRKNDEKMPPWILRLGLSYLRCNRSLDENFLPGIRGTVNATSGPVAALRFA